MFLQGREEGGLIWLTEASSMVYYDSGHPTHLETICVHMNAAQI